METDTKGSQGAPFSNTSARFHCGANCRTLGLSRLNHLIKAEKSWKTLTLIYHDNTVHWKQPCDSLQQYQRQVCVPQTNREGNPQSAGQRP
ncbi:hypothetical protein FGO68_gene11838 [Halteria grandinella]|uniref:Uncharacterized protein n=1 Tax=Halteria grandinella TaxID=5974 RepID=A0A8J8STK7_HALGN|nr:hypothetical protein FGO68_gene11838 [Halteria grandinella]